MKMKPRLGKLAGRVETLAPIADRNAPVTDADWLATFERVATDGVMADEPDLPRALAEYRAAIEAAGESLNPPEDFKPGEKWESRVEGWRIAHPIPAVDTARAWMVELFLRSTDGVPPIPEAEFAELAAWFQANESTLREAMKPSDRLDLGDGTRESLTNLRWGIHQGPRATDAGIVAEKLRKAKARYGG